MESLICLDSTFFKNIFIDILLHLNYNEHNLSTTEYHSRKGETLEGVS
jgi:restriction endonuclease Mrr